MNHDRLEDYGISLFDPAAIAINDLLDRVMELEAKQRKSTRKTITAAQKILLLETTGLMEKIDELFSENAIKKDKIQFLSYLLNDDLDNIDKHITDVRKIKTERNYKALSDLFEEVKLNNHKAEIQPILEGLKKKG
jgi:EAL domain-containing protein (putative c-di-GMP-specific phosphodiesterase class I)